MSSAAFSAVVVALSSVVTRVPVVVVVVVATNVAFAIAVPPHGRGGGECLGLLGPGLRTKRTA